MSRAKFLTDELLNAIQTEQSIFSIQCLIYIEAQIVLA